jgi:hypothetical protein
MNDAAIKDEGNATVGVKMDRAQLERRRHELQREKRRAKRALEDADREIGEINNQLRRAPNATS